MAVLHRVVIIFFSLFHLSACQGQNQSSSIEEETLSEDFDESSPLRYGMPKRMASSDVSPGWTQHGQKIMLTGTVYELDATTPAVDVILYYYQTNPQGVYATKSDEPRNMPKNELGQTHGYIRGWVKTGIDGKYSIKTVLPGTYPSRSEPAHVHLTVMERFEMDPYYIDDFVFDNDPLLTSERRRKMENRGGSGVIRFVEKNGIKVGERNLILGLNIPNYPKKVIEKIESGKQIGEQIESFTPYHAFGTDKGTKTCPICKYGWYHGILFFVGNNPNWSEIREWLKFLDQEGEKRGRFLKSYFVYGKENDYVKEDRISELERIGNELEIKNVALTFVPSFSDRSSMIFLNKINQNLENTFVLYRRSTVISTFTDLKPTEENILKIQQRLDQTANEYFSLPRAKKE